MLSVVGILVCLPILLAPIRLVTASSDAISRALIVGRDVRLTDKYDYVIVGAGTAGLTVADRLSENPDGVYFFPTFLRYDLRVVLLL